MNERTIRPTGIERTFGEEEIIVSKTDRSGRVTYANDVFLAIAGYTEAEVIGQPHSLIRHPDMPRGVFKVLWDGLFDKKEVFAYVKNMTRRGDHYWVFAHVTPTFDANGEIVGFHSNRRTPERSAIEKVEPLYEVLLAEERKHQSKQDQVAASTRLFAKFLAERHTTYDALVWSLAA